MRSIFILTVFFLAGALCFLVQSLSAQAPVLHEYFPFSGEAKVFFDKNLLQVDSSSASYYVYVFVEKGKDVWSLRPWWKKHHRLYGPIANETASFDTTNGPVPLNGLIVWYKKDQSRPRVTEFYKDGRNAEKTTIYDRKGRVKEVYDYSRTWDRQPWGYYYEKMRKGEIEKAGFEYFDTKKMRWESICTRGCYVTKDLRE